MSNLSDIAFGLAAAEERARISSEQLKEVVNGPEHVEVETDTGPVPTVKEFLRQAKQQIDETIQKDVGDLHQAVVQVDEARNDTRALKDEAEELTTQATQTVQEGFNAFGDATDPDKGAAMVGAKMDAPGTVGRSQADENRDRVSVRRWTGDADVDGVTSNQVGIVAAVAYCHENGCDLEWPAGTYVSTESIPHFHDIGHVGRGVIRIDGESYFISPRRASHRNTIYVDGVNGNDGNDGLSSSRPFKTIQSAFNATQGISSLPRLSFGTWRIKIAGNQTYSEAASWDAAIAVANYFEVLGEVDESGLPTVRIDGTASTKTGGLYFDGGPSRLKVKDIDSSNFRDNSVASGFVFANKGIQKLWIDNLCGTNNIWAGVNVDNIGQLIMEGGILEGNTQYNLRVRGGVAISIGKSTNRIRLANCATNVQIRDGSHGHFDFVDIDNAGIGGTGMGLWAANCSRVVLTSCTLSNMSIGLQSDTNSTVSYIDTAFNSVPTKYRTRNSGNFDAITAEDNSLGGAGLEYDAFFDRYSTGLRQWSPSTEPHGTSTHVWAARREGVSSFSYLVPDGAEIQMLYGNVANRALFSHQINPANLRYSWSANGVFCLRADANAVFSGRDNMASCGTAVSRWSQVYSATGAINTSDERDKQQVRLLSGAERNVAIRLKSMVRAFKFNDAVKDKGDGARIHFGFIAQEIKAVFEEEGLIAEDYALLCYDEWDEQPEVWGDISEERNEAGEIISPARRELVQEHRAAGSRYGVRYEELLAFILSAM